MFKRILIYAEDQKKKMMLATMLLLLSVLAGVFPFVMVYQIITPLINGRTLATGDILIRVGMVLFFLVFQAVFMGIGLDLSHKAAYGTLKNIRISLQEKMEKLPLGVIEQKGTGRLKKLFVDDVDSLETLLAHAIPEGFANVMVPLVIYGILMIVDWKLALMAMASVPLSLLAMTTMYTIGMKRMGAYFTAGQTMNNTIIEYINGMEVVKVFNREGESYQRFKTDVENYRDFTLKWFKACWPWMAVYGCLLPYTLILTLPLGSYFVLQGYSTLPDLILTMCMSMGLGIPLLRALSFISALPQLNYKLAEVESVIDATPLKAGTASFSGTDHSVLFTDVSFGYHDAKVIHHINLSAKPGETIALVGESGSGKSTLAKLLVHYYDVNAGKISIGGQNICTMSLEALNDCISYVAQDQFLFNTSIRENIRLGKPEAGEEAILLAAEKAQCLEFIRQLPNGIDTLAGDCGNQLSGGQKQRITLARAILKNAPILVLDEATAFADPENEEKMEAALAALVHNKTTFVIAHRLASVMGADQIYVLENGSISAHGTHQELLENSSLYQKLWMHNQKSADWQMKEVKDND
ncbi:ABC transporter ATP-binding protein [Acetobacterium bakii]|uniref:ABC transporter ATP-binding protein n=1 Tax=Acetobacterium bakii TaxID=52689 RepID=A0A0L6TVF2_9FIRM|nr:ABC transporter ATP-binding protein [Acetobacterium bakii]KNZ40238.1 ABC transporter ATP-binding protein [Acetobacterium bakii]